MQTNNHLNELVGQHYNNILEYEIDRLIKYSPVEYAITVRFINRYIPNNVIVGEVGVGGGLYTQLLAKKNCQLYLADVSSRLLNRVVQLFEEQDLSKQIISASLVSGINLNTFPDSSLDALLFMGPLYHLCSFESRKKAIHEAARVLKPTGIIFAAGINRLAYLRDLFLEAPEKVIESTTFHEKYLSDGNLDPYHAPPIGFAHLTTRDEFSNLFLNDFEEITLLAVEGFLSPFQDRFLNLSNEIQNGWLDLVEKTSQLPDSFGIADHLLYIGRKR
jgi:ubiquinone/menaquinone biosynthesis C-methylase UbiE